MQLKQDFSGIEEIKSQREKAGETRKNNEPRECT
jgi:hypothetical protein